MNNHFHSIRIKSIIVTTDKHWFFKMLIFVLYLVKLPELKNAEDKNTLGKALLSCS